jgi:hypothetical protein
MAQINKSSEYFNTVLYTGNDASNRAITGYNFSPDLVWHKSRSNPYNHYLFDKVRGVGKSLFSNLTSAEDTSSFTTSFNSFDSDGFTVTQVGGIEMNQNAVTYANWGWKANGAGVSNTDGTITSTVSANTTSGFSIVSYTGNGSNATVGHGLGVAPKMIIAKCLDNAKHWLVFHNSLDTNKNLYLNLTNTEDTPSPEIYRKGSFTDNVFAIGTHDRINASSQSMVAYCFAEKKGFSKFGSYTGNGNADGTFIYTGFKPAFVMFKNTSSALFWQIHDSARDSFNEVQKRLAPNSSDAEGSGSIPIDFLSNGIKLRTTATTWNESGSNFIYMAFAENPLVGTNNIPTTAR